MAKMLASEAAWHAAEACMQTHGGFGFARSTTPGASGARPACSRSRRFDQPWYGLHCRARARPPPVILTGLNPLRPSRHRRFEMDYVRLGSTGMKVSRLCLGCMTFGQPDRGAHPWTLDAAQSLPIIRQALEAGINFFDTANSYSEGTSEEILGDALRQYARRDEVVIATKVYNRMKPTPNGSGLSRKAIFNEIDQSLRRLGTDYVDLYQIHRWDPATQVEETLDALHDVVKAGKARYIGASTMPAWQFAKALHVSDSRRLTRFVTMQNHLNLLYREEEREMMPLCHDQGIGVLPWSPLARGRLARPWGQTSSRMETDAFGHKLYSACAEADRQV